MPRSEIWPLQVCTVVLSHTHDFWQSVRRMSKFPMLTADRIVSQRGVVFFRKQRLDIEEQKILGTKLGELTGKPDTSKVGIPVFEVLREGDVCEGFMADTPPRVMQLHRHALSNSKRGIAVDENGKLDDEISVISSEVWKSCGPVMIAPSLTLTCSLCPIAKPQILQRSLLCAVQAPR